MKREYILAGASIFFWSTLAVCAKMLLGNYSNFQVLCLSSFFAAITLFLIVAVTGKLKLFKEYGMKKNCRIALAGFPGIFLYHALYYGGAALLPASDAFIINYLWPVVSIVFACIILKEKMNFRKILAVILSFVGVAVVTGGSFSGFGGGEFTGAILCMLAAVSYGFYTVVNKKIDADQVFAMMINCVVSFVITAIYLIIQGEFIIPVYDELAGFIWSGVFTIAIPGITWILALKKGNTAKISNLAYITPFLSLVWSSVILKESLTINCIAGLLLIITGIFIQLVKGKSEKE